MSSNGGKEEFLLAKWNSYLFLLEKEWRIKTLIYMVFTIILVYIEGQLNGFQLTEQKKCFTHPLYLLHSTLFPECHINAISAFPNLPQYLLYFSQILPQLLTYLINYF